MWLEDLISSSNNSSYPLWVASLCVALVLPLFLLHHLSLRSISSTAKTKKNKSNQQKWGAVPYLTTNTPESRHTGWLPYIGQGLTFLRHPPWDLLKTWNETYGGVIAFPLLGTTVFSLTDAAAVRAVLQSHTMHLKKDIENTMREFLSLLGTGIVTSEGSSWLKQRRRMSHPLRVDILAIIPIQTVAAVQRLMRRLDAAAERDERVPLGSLLRHLTLQVISGSFLSLPPDESDATLARLYLPIVDESNVRVWHSYRGYCFFLPSFWKYHWNVYRLNRYVSQLIRQRWDLRRREKQQQQREDNGGTTTPLSSSRREDILDKVLADYEKEFPDDAVLPEYAVRQFRDEMKTFMLAGHE